MGNLLEERVIDLGNDYEGRVIAVLVKSKIEERTSRAVLYMHGFNDYFFQNEMAQEFNEHGFNFYALDLRKYGRSLLPDQTFNDARDLSIYFREMLNALEIIRAEGHRHIVLGGHSTGGLIATLFAQMYDHLIDGLWLNSPFFEFNYNWIFRKVLIPTASCLGRFMPNVSVPGGFSKQYGISLHKTERGEWDYDLHLKPHIPPKVSMGWIRAVHEGHKQFNKGIMLDIPVLIMCSAQSSSVSKKWDNLAMKSDIILDVDTIKKKSGLIDGDVTLMSIENAIHDLVLSTKEVRAKVYRELFGWMNQKIRV